MAKVFYTTGAKRTEEFFADHINKTYKALGYSTMLFPSVEEARQLDLEEGCNPDNDVYKITIEKVTE